MKKFIPYLLFSLILSGAYAQDSTAMKAHYLKVYNQALTYNDANAAINALHNYIATDDNISYKDTLSLLYFTTRSYYSSLLLAEEVYKKRPDNINAMARAAECYQELGDPKTAISLYEQVVPKTKNPYHIYKMALAQFQLKRTAECETSAKMVIADTNSKKMGINLPLATGGQQTALINAAAANLLGILYAENKNIPQAKEYFKQALIFFPEFVVAKQNLDSLEPKPEVKKPAVKTKQ